jgi:diaminohydroxyphosphoribosylaminopyrimidine deaminase/5-amino-6-(5-phosphoribosylamino)uracil reductase
VFEGGPLVLAACEGFDTERASAVQGAGARVWALPEEGGRPSIGGLLRKLSEEGVMHLLVEGGGQVAASFLGGGWVDRVAVFVAPKIAGAGRPGVADLAIDRMAGAVGLSSVTTERLGEDFLVTADVVRQGRAAA